LGYLIGFGMVIVATLAGVLLQTLSFYDPTDTNMLYILGVTISAAYLGFGPSFLTAILSVLAFDFFFIPPVLTLNVSTEKGVVGLLILAVVTGAISCLSPRIRQ
jgi:two-component system, OmpR family, sensor histidine kinase KdpD